MHTLISILCSLGLIIFPASDISGQDTTDPWKTYQNTRLFSLGNSAYYFVGGVTAIDADGAPNAYHPADTGLDFLANAGYPEHSWWADVLVVDPENSDSAYVQQTGEYAGYFVSKTALQDPVRAATDPERYVDARTVPYFVFPGNFYAIEGTGILGDLGIAVNVKTGDQSAFVVADIGPGQASLGEVSISLAERLGGSDVDPRTGAGSPGGKILYILFPYSGREHEWPLTNLEITASAGDLLCSFGSYHEILQSGNIP